MCSAWNGDKPVEAFVTEWEEQIASVLMVFLSYLCLSGYCCLVFLAVIIMASAEETEGALAPVDFIQLQHYMEGELSYLNHLCTGNDYTLQLHTEAF